MTEKEKAGAGLLYNNNYDEELIRERMHCQAACQQYNLLPVHDLDGRAAQIRSIVGQIGENFCIEQPFRCDYGYNIRIGEHFYSNYNLVILDEADVTIGDNVFIAPDCGIYTAGHPIEYRLRNEGLEYAKPVTIGDNVWIGGGVKILPGASIGSNVVIGAGSVVTGAIPSNVVAVGAPCRPIRTIEAE
ncbi:MAG: sugar O-acetyltransferase [Eubacteriales bacterium]|nr:sugar O-acetyltransferase [Eubacteriales bacterium]